MGVVNEEFEEWPLNDEGYPYRRAARVIVLDSRNRIFLTLGHDIDNAHLKWWFTPGGGREGEETATQAAVRELFEETGLRISIKRLHGPVIMRYTTFRFLAKTRKQDEEFFLLYVSDSEAQLLAADKTSGWTALERKVLDEQRWWDIDELDKAQRAGIQVYPQNLVELVRGWKDGWDGKCHTIIEE
ncbi:NUDIX domain-containing protein [Arcanobacterium phocisimile]|uniref:NUDIX domain-containing protein n=1 Tax=Arcanobacterium phocisimile TaxID=1302235 RepID=A0ABX7IJK0_9ACTO|nr:NUDIX domain-containing protein [Arcanobacterium phocisimile]QRV02910.1 NUDIX domain-containing protein [Arcanobacterium phocisimile]